MPKTRRRDQNATTTIALDVSYKDFGGYGHEFQKLFTNVWENVERLWKEQMRVSDLPPLRAALDTTLDRSGYWFDQLMTRFVLLGTMTEQHFGAVLWPDFRRLFNPLLAELEVVRKPSGLRDTLLETLAAATYNDRHGRRLQELSSVCYGPFSRAELRLLLEEHPRLLELGAGSGYFAYEFLRRGGDVIALEPDNYGYLTKTNYHWTKELLQQNRLRISGHEVFDESLAQRALLLSWPEPGALYPAEALQHYTALGGQTLILKLGGYMGKRPDIQGYTPPLTPEANVRNFLEILVRDWLEVEPEHQPPYNPEAYRNNVWIFRRKKG